MIRMGLTEDRGRGVFATRRIEAGEVLEEAPVIVIPHDQRDHVKRTALFHYFFQWGSSSQSDCAICLGLGSIYNHDANPNAKYVRVFDQQVIRFVALRGISEGEEICTNYNGDAADTKPMWFEI